MPVCLPTPEEPFGSQRVSAPSATGGSAGALSRAAVPVGPERTSPRSSSLEFRVSRAPCRALGMPGHTTPGPCACFHPCTCLASLHCPNHRGSSFRLSGAAGVLEGDQLQLRGTPCPQSLSTPRVPLSPWPPGGSGHSRAISPSWRVPGVKAADGVRVVRLHRKAGEVNAFCPEDQHVATSRNEVLQGWSPEPPSGSRPSPWGPQRPWRGSLGGALWAGLSGRAVGSQH